MIVYVCNNPICPSTIYHSIQGKCEHCGEELIEWNTKELDNK